MKKSFSSFFITLAGMSFHTKGTDLNEWKLKGGVAPQRVVSRPAAVLEKSSRSRVTCSGSVSRSQDGGGE